MRVNFVSKDLIKKLKVLERILMRSKVTSYNAITIDASDKGTYLYAKNSSVEIITKVGSKVLEAGTITLLGDYFCNIIKTYPSEAPVHLFNNQLECGKFNNVVAEVAGGGLEISLPENSKHDEDFIDGLGYFPWADRVFFSNGSIVGLNKGNTQLGVLNGISVLNGNFYLSQDFISIINTFNGDCKVFQNKTNVTVVKEDYIITGALQPMEKVPDFSIFYPDSSMATFEIPSDIKTAIQNADSTTGGEPISISFNNGSVYVTANNPKIGDLNVELKANNMVGSGKITFRAGQILNALTRANKSLHHRKGLIILSNPDRNYLEVVSEYVKSY